ncbi:hypothetical protein LR48_Vigan02g222300 [Vigna angularis]|uniref:Uncharacterized protein n=1 Tax=Phaseolus angularis TaxID=3914 RepID=A0A0L9TZQ9_PHAAN|nr:hypothetical protein LR48_Vigan02g222300 [Vigna angularis]
MVERPYKVVRENLAIQGTILTEWFTKTLPNGHTKQKEKVIERPPFNQTKLLTERPTVRSSLQPRQGFLLPAPLRTVRLLLLTSTWMIIAMTKTNVQNMTRQETQATTFVHPGDVVTGIPSTAATRVLQKLTKQKTNNGSDEMKPELGLHVSDNERLTRRRNYQFII